MHGREYECFQTLGANLRSLYSKDHSILGPVLRPLVFGSSHMDPINEQLNVSDLLLVFSGQTKTNGQ